MKKLRAVDGTVFSYDTKDVLRQAEIYSLLMKSKRPAIEAPRTGLFAEEKHETQR